MILKVTIALLYIMLLILHIFIGSIDCSIVLVMEEIKWFCEVLILSKGPMVISNL